MKRKPAFNILIFLLCFASVGSLSAAGAHSGVQGGLFFQKYSLKNDLQVQEWIFPIIYRTRLGNRFSLQLSNSPARASSTITSETLSGPADTRLQLAYLSSGGHLVLAAGFGLPTGPNRLEEDQFTLSSLLAHDALGFRLPVFGRGAELQLNTAYVLTLGDFILSGGIGFLFTGAYRPFSGESAEYDPGNELSLTLGADRRLAVGDGSLRLRMDALYTAYGKDRYAGTTVYRAGGRLRLEMVTAYSRGRHNLRLFLLYRTRGQSERGRGTLSAVAQKETGRQLESGLVAAYRISPRLRLKLLLDWKDHSLSESGSNGATIYGGGPGVSLRLLEHLETDLHFKYLSGKLKSRDHSTGLSGYEIGGLLIFSF